MITAKVIKKSLASQTGAELVTLELNYPRYIHAEFMTHRVFSRNAQSSRAIPISKAIDNLIDDPVEPVFVRNQKGMQADHEMVGNELRLAQTQWDIARDLAIECARNLDTLGLHKQIANRILEPFSNIRVIVSSTEWENFFRLRIAPDAQQEINELAVAIKEAIDASKGQELNDGHYHLPYITEEEKYIYKHDEFTLIRCSIARCARVSYLNHDKELPNIANDIKLYEQLLSSRHMSPFEHVAVPKEGWYANFKNWVSYRSQLEG